MKFWQGGKKQNSAKNYNNRINFTIAIIFIFAAVILYRLYYLQIKEYDLFIVKADSQHLSSGILAPVRGKIFIQDGFDEKNSQLYPIATNKKFALLYAVPKDVKESVKVAEIFYIFFDKENTAEEVDEFLDKNNKDKLENDLRALEILPAEAREEKKIAINKKYEEYCKSPEYKEIRNIRREAEINLRKDVIMEKYLQKLNKKNDPYEPIQKKVDEDELKNIYISLLGDKGKNLSPDKLIIKEDNIFEQNSETDAVKIIIDGIGFVMRNYRFYPENNIGSQMIGFVSIAGDEDRGQYGLEGFFDNELYGEFGSIKTGRGASGDLIIINEREYTKAINGNDIILTINRAIQYTVCQKLNSTALRHGADSGSIIIINPKTGAILAMCSWPDYDPNNFSNESDINIFNNPVIFEQYEPGSIFKGITMAAAIDQGKLEPDSTYDDKGSILIEGWPKPIKNSDYETHGGHGVTDMNEVLTQSLNTGAIFAMNKITPEVFAQYVKNFGFGEKTGIELETENFGNIGNLTANKIKPIDAATASFGQGISVTPLQMIMAYGAIANGGILMKPYLVKEILYADGTKIETQPQEIRRVISERASVLVSGMLVNVVDNGHTKRAAVKGYYVAGKTGTAQVPFKDKRGYSDKTIHTFVGFAPVEDPKFAMLVKLNDPKDATFAESTSAPLFSELAEFILDYYQVSKDR
ncbi:hypothetical protein CO115_03330 [Candidatus Falkowbacteria bacterium CG_4_9_14_3_um_filter_36_9]|uniref:Penicillin-binding protein transpeptidase domain-containing protein n=2 Tax=Candidatus Falkowiibacteriota TaxID=1752728 RepID=A0A1J4T5D9_9BACT|nr:MAG: hypothetical protein AUJ27_03825 [Candidatus Falkowbacteria bacterium CG1_02_37_44]PIV50527.1 MAG: hypothetical protein COS18_04815 [Candidatus Falkowbacteria bacterium CG02_land_8_20_14_3_00_36_14]PIX11475.1 MAG: hypothetical protein COZ73_02535 [Candidatus Falkowbacteria bacterium CG_4_8_14_3_um_filter_36_11]PJA10361.1 MAG: hypothetical protein COX67_04745 [Candidatus Falkowbacteria bacterium CG_4_10_14_0_2_um_filter_36_22]PJB19050.1 MAG: hypothetical protein CO115_03330 [Candidatus F